MESLGRIKSLFGHAGVYAIGRVLDRGIGFLMLPVYTRYLTTADYGVLEILSVTTTYINSFLSLGIGDMVAKYWIRERESRGAVIATATVLFLCICTAGITPFLLFPDSASAILLGSQEYGRHLFWALIVLPLGTPFTILSARMRAEKQSALLTGLLLFKLLISLAGNVLFIVYLKKGSLGIFWSDFASYVITIPFVAYMLWSTEGLRFSKPLARSMLAFGLPFLPSNLANTITRSSDRYFIRYFSSLSAVGLYGLSYKIGIVIHQFVTSSFLGAWIPTRLEDANGQRFERLFSYFLSLLCFSGLLVSVFTDPMLSVMVTQEFRAAGQLVPLIVLAHIPAAAYYYYHPVILASGRTKFLMYCDVASGLLTMAANVVLIYYYGALGAALATAISYVSRFMLVRAFANHLAFVPFETVKAIKLVALAAALYGASTQIGDVSFVADLGLRAAICGVYPMLLGKLGIFERSDKELAREGFSRLGIDPEGLPGRCALTLAGLR